MGEQKSADQTLSKMAPVHAVPSLERTLLELQRNPYLTAVVQLAHLHKLNGFGGVDCFDQMVAGDVTENEVHNSPQLDLLEYIRDMTLEDKHAVVPHVRRLGYSVIVFDFDLECPFSLNFPGSAPTPIFRETYQTPVTLLYATSPPMMRLRGLLFCISRLLAWKHRALTYFQGALVTLRQEAAAEYQAMFEGTL